jgi:Ca2+-binding RTX toxin-like protein
MAEAKMAITWINSNILGSGGTGSAGIEIENADGVVVLAGYSFGWNTGAAIAVEGVGNFIHVLGQVYGLDGAIRLSDIASPLAGHRLVVGAEGSVWGKGAAGIYSVSGNSSILNNGTIGGDFSAITIEESGLESHSRLVNRGEIVGNTAAVRLYLFSGADYTLENLAGGVISGGAIGLEISCSNSCDVTIVNAGLITARGYAIFTDGPPQSISLTNSGKIDGDVVLGAGADVIDSRNGQIDGLVSLGGGTDRFQGGSGLDAVWGGAGKDTISGGLGADDFVYNRASEGRDVITDWNRSDDFHMEAAGFGGGLEAGALAAGRFVSGTTNKAQDANDRFVFRTTDATLWFDIDGKSGVGPRLIADLQAGAKVTAGDILLI